MARLYPPVTEETLPAFCLTYNDKGEKIGATIKINFQMNQAVASSEITGIALRLRTISTNDYVITEQLEKNLTFGEKGLSEGLAMDYDLNNGVAIFSITNEYNPLALEKLRVGQYYKAQLAYVDLNGSIGYWSTIAAIKCVARPNVTINGYQSDDVNVFSNEIIGNYQQDITSGDTTEKVYSYKFILYDTDGESVYDETKVLLHNSSNDESSNLSKDIFYCYKELEKNKIYYLIYQVTTINGLEVSSPIYQVTNIGSIPPEDDIGLFVFNGTESNYVGSEDLRPFEEGIIKLYIDFNTATDRLSQKTVTGNFVITRSSSKDNFTSWQEVRRFRLGGITPSSKIIYDYTVEQGISYRYAVQQFNRQHFYSDKVYAYERDEYFNLILNSDGQPIIKEIKADFEDMFLYDGKRQLKIKFNPKVSSFKNDLQEQKIDTIGSKYPFIFRNGSVCYKEFPISGLISFQQDNAFLFISDEDYNQMDLKRFEATGTRSQPVKEKYVVVSNSSDRYNNKIILYKKELVEEPVYDFKDIHENLQFKKPIYYKTMEQFVVASHSERQKLSLDQLYKIDNGNQNYDIDRSSTYNKTDLTSNNIMSERYFKLSVLDWLTDGKPKLFKSPTEGNYIVRLLNVSLTPSDSLGRMLHTFSCTAYEIADFDYNSLKDFGLLTVEEQSTEVEYEWFASNIKTLISSNNLIDFNEENEEYYMVNIGNNELFSFECINFAPGDKIRITTESNPIPMIITIGQTGTYIYEDGEQVLSLSICPSGGWGGFSRDISLKTKGYKYRPFDMIASMHLHTQYGEQIVGKMNNFFAPTVVQSDHDIADQTDINYYTKKYYEANNVSLHEDFIPVAKENMSEELFNAGTFYTSTGRGRNTKYFFANAYNKNETYFKRIQKGMKIIPFDLLYLHAKKREVIPIFTSFSRPGGISPYKDSLTTATFSLTPTGNGYVKYSSICNTKEWLDTTNLTLEQREKAYTIQDLVDLTFSQVQHLDKFCLFELYVPNVTAIGTPATGWAPYSEIVSNNDSFVGIFDPYLYKKLMSDPSLPKPSTDLGIQRLGWWTKDIEGKYDPSFIISYGEYENRNTEYFSLQDDIEITLKNLTVPSDLSTNNGVVIELIYRVKYIDYTIEMEDENIRNLKDLYNKKQETSLKAMSQYRFSQYGELIAKDLMNKPSSISSRLNLGENYLTIAKALTNAIRKDQIEKIQEYLYSENNLITNLAFELEYIDNSLGYQSNIKESLKPIGIYEVKDGTYAKFIQDALISIQNDNVLPSIDSYAQADYIASAGGTIELAIEKASAEIKQKVNFYLQNQNTNVWNFNYIFNNLLDEQIPGSLANMRAKQKQILTSMGPIRYVSEYIDLLNQNKVNKFFNIVNPEINGEPLYEIDYRIGDLLNKQPLPQEIENIPTQYVNWNEYFHIEESDDIYPVLGQIEANYDKNKQQVIYTINNLDAYFSMHSGFLFTKKVQNTKDTLLSLIQKQLIKLNTDYGISNIDAYKNKYQVDNFNSEDKPILFQNKNNENNNQIPQFILLQVCNIDDNEQLVKISNSVETILDNLFSRGIISKDMDNNILKNLLISSFKNSQKYLEQIPEHLVLERYVQILVEYYIKTDLRELYQKAYTYQTYYNDYHLNFTDSQSAYLKETIKTLINKIKDSKAQLNKALNSFKLIILEWKQDWERAINNTEATELIQQTNNYINAFNLIINTKNEAINNYKNAQQNIKSIQSNVNIQASDNIREKYWEEWKAYDYAIKQIEQLKIVFQETYIKLQEENYIVSYPEFLKDYLLNLSYNEDIDNEYQKYIQQIVQYTHLFVDKEQSPLNQKQNMKTAWKIFLDALANKYKKMS